MKLHRVTRPLSSGQKPGDIVTAKNFGGGDIRGKEIVEKLAKTGALSPVMMPPLAAMVGWGNVAKSLKPHKITSAEGLMSADVGKLAKKLSCQPEIILSWQESLMATMMPGEIPSPVELDEQVVEGDNDERDEQDDSVAVKPKRKKGATKESDPEAIEKDVQDSEAVQVPQVEVLEVVIDDTERLAPLASDHGANSAEGGER